MVCLLQKYSFTSHEIGKRGVVRNREWLEGSRRNWRRGKWPGGMGGRTFLSLPLPGTVKQ